jgi:purine nucleoside permease
MEETGTYRAITYLHNIQRADKDRFLVLRTGSNYSMQPPGVSAAENLLRENDGYAGLNAAVESLYSVGSTVVQEILDNWSTYKTTPPASDQ